MRFCNYENAFQDMVVSPFATTGVRLRDFGAEIFIVSVKIT
jgi:hypothetical protein